MAHWIQHYKAGSLLNDLNTPVRIYMVGGAVRDHLDLLFPVQSKDFDFAVEALDYGHMRSWLTAHGAKIWQERPVFGTIRCNIPTAVFAGEFEGLLPDLTMNADFTLCRKDGFYSDSRHPDEVFPGNIFEDLQRRDFTVNAIAITQKGEILDPHMGQYDIRNRVVRAVGNPNDRLREDPLRILRAMRFRVTKEMVIDYSLLTAMKHCAADISIVSPERIVEELSRMFTHNTLASMQLLASLPEITNTLFNHGSKLWLQPTLRNRD
jgi:tRNA nucleotidyltransferase/poly(A) polymerase